jgi:hypothetical protein
MLSVDQVKVLMNIRKFALKACNYHQISCIYSLFYPPPQYTWRMLSEASHAAKRRNGNIRRRIETLLVKAHELGGYGVDIAIIIRRNNQYTTSTNGRALELLLAEMVAMTLLFFAEFIAETRKENAQPLPKRLLPPDLERVAAKRKLTAAAQDERMGGCGHGTELPVGG